MDSPGSSPSTAQRPRAGESEEGEWERSRRRIEGERGKRVMNEVGFSDEGLRQVEGVCKEERGRDNGICD